MLKTGFGKKVHIQGFVNEPTICFGCSGAFYMYFLISIFMLFHLCCACRLLKYLFSKIKDDLNLLHAEARYMYILI